MMNYAKSIQKTHINFPFQILKISPQSPVKQLTLAVLGVHGCFTLGGKAPNIHWTGAQSGRRPIWRTVTNEKGKNHSVLTGV
jgi:hypothetical protein